jgi:hypothetical protein
MLWDREDLAEVVVKQRQRAIYLVECEAELVRGALREAHRSDVGWDIARNVSLVFVGLSLVDVHPELNVAVGHGETVGPHVMFESDRDRPATVREDRGIAETELVIDVELAVVSEPVERPP